MIKKKKNLKTLNGELSLRMDIFF